MSESNGILEITGKAGGLPASNAVSWLDSARERARQAFTRSGLPTSRDESWKYTSLHALTRGNYSLPGTPGAAPTPQADISAVLDPVRDQDAAARIVFVNGVLDQTLSERGELPAGLEVMSLGTALKRQPDTLRAFMERSWSGGSSDALANLNAALAQDGLVLRVAPGVRLEQPIHLVMVGVPGEQALAINLRHLVMLGADCQATIVEHAVDTGENGHFWNSLSQIELADGANLDHVQLQTRDNGSTALHRAEITQQAGSRYRSWIGELGGRIARHEQHVRLAGKNSQCRLDGVFIGQGKRHLDNQIVVDHQVPDCTSTQTWRGVLDDRSRGVYNGKVVVRAGADGTDAHQSSGNLLLSPHAEVDTKPELEIYAEDVRCAHGATVGQLDEEQLFYLRSRGIDEDHARALLIAGFCREVLEGLPESLHALLREALEQRLRGTRS